MTTDRTAAPTRSTALADRPSSAGRTQAPPSDAFAALLGAVAPKQGDAQSRRDDVADRRGDATNRRSDTSERRDDVANRRDDATRADRARRADRQQHERPDAPRATVQPKDAPVADAPEATADTDAAATEAPAVPTTPSLFAMQLASPLPPAAPQTQAAPAQTTDAAALPTFAGQIPASVAAATTTTQPTAATTEPATPAGDPQATTGAVALTGLPAEATADTTVPAGLDLSKVTAAAIAATPSQDAAVPADASQQPGGDASGQEQPNTPNTPSTPAQPATPAAAATATATAKVDAPVAPAPVAAPVTNVPLTAQAAPAQITTPSVERAVPLSRAVATTGVLIHMAAERGVTHARLNLKPVELGGIEVRLQTSPQGVHAQLVADSPEAARMLSSASEDLRRSLEDRNVTLLSLDVSTSGDHNRDQPAQFTDAFGESYRPGGPIGSHREVPGLTDSPALAETTLVLPDGVHVDVLA